MYPNMVNREVYPLHRAGVVADLLTDADVAEAMGATTGLPLA